VLILSFENVTAFKNVDRVAGGVLLINPEFTKYSFVIRYLFFAFSLIAAVIYIVRFRKIPTSERIL